MRYFLFFIYIISLCLMDTFTYAFQISSPSSVFLYPKGGRFFVEEQLTVNKDNSGLFVEFILPNSATNLFITVQDKPISTFSSTIVSIMGNSTLYKKREMLIKQKLELEGQLETCKSRLALWKTTSSSTTFSEMEKLDNKINILVPELYSNISDIEAKLVRLNNEIDSLYEGKMVGNLIKLSLPSDYTEGKKVNINYSYDFLECGWKPIYAINADTKSNNGILIRLLAEMWQYSGIDFENTKITLATQSSQKRSPSNLPAWNLEAKHNADLMVMNESAARSGGIEPNLVSSESNKKSKLVNDNTAIADLSGVYTSWILKTSTLPEGISKAFIQEDTWKSPLVWLVRPLKDNAFAYLMSKYEVTGNFVWPDGQCEYSVDGKSIGRGTFALRDKEVTLFFGADPLVQVVVNMDTRKRGESGIFGKKRNHVFAWTYTINNLHEKSIHVRIERPMPRIVDQDISVEYDNSPQASMDNKKHIISWDFDISSKGSKNIKHSLTISAPADMNFYPTAP